MFFSSLNCVNLIFLLWLYPGVFLISGLGTIIGQVLSQNLVAWEVWPKNSGGHLLFKQSSFSNFKSLYVMASPIFQPCLRGGNIYHSVFYIFMGYMLCSQIYSWQKSNECPECSKYPRDFFRAVISDVTCWVLEGRWFMHQPIQLHCSSKGFSFNCS